jgi:hypothetical protein
MKDKDITKSMLRGQYVIGYVSSIQISGTIPNERKELTIRLVDADDNFKDYVLSDGSSGKVVIIAI